MIARNVVNWFLLFSNPSEPSKPTPALEDASFGARLQQPRQRLPSPDVLVWGNFVPKQRRFSKMMLAYICQSQSPNSSHPSFLVGIHMFVLYIFVSISAL